MQKAQVVHLAARAEGKIGPSASPAEVWPWIAQIGADKGGFYSYEWLENLAGCEVRNAETTHAEWVRAHVLLFAQALRFAKDPGANRLLSRRRCTLVCALLHPRTMKATIESAGGVASRVQIGSHTLTFDQPPAVPGGEDHGPSPLDVLVVSVGACAHYFAAAFLHGRRLPVEGLRVEVEANKGRTPSPRIEKLSVRVMLPAGVNESYLPSIERAIRNCPAYGTLVHPPDVELLVVKETPQNLTLAS